MNDQPITPAALAVPGTGWVVSMKDEHTGEWEQMPVLAWQYTLHDGWHPVVWDVSGQWDVPLTSRHSGDAWYAWHPAQAIDHDEARSSAVEVQNHARPRLA